MVNAGKDNSIAQMLLNAASQDLAACQLLSDGPGIGDAVVGFHAQQSVEKSLKAVLSVRSQPQCRGHAAVAGRPSPSRQTF